MPNQPAERLVDFLEEYVLRPGMSAIAEHYAADQRELLADVEARLRRKLASYRACENGFDVVRCYQSELDSADGQVLEHQQRVLNLPTFRQVKKDFLELAGKLQPDG